MKIFLLGILSILILGVVGFVLSLNKTPEEEEQTQEQQQKEQTIPMQSKTLQIEDIVVGEGAEAVSGKLISVHYTGTLADGTKFDSSLDRGTPFEFILGTGQVIRGWDQGIEGMKVGGKRKLIIPPELGYGAAGIPGTIPPNSTLVFEVELLDIRE